MRLFSIEVIHQPSERRNEGGDCPKETAGKGRTQKDSEDKEKQDRMQK